MLDFAPPPKGVSAAYLEHYPAPGGQAHRIPLEHLPFRIGRGANVQYMLAARQVSKEHAEITREGEQFRIRDLDSTNGTFVNGRRVTEAVLAHGDVIHLADKEFQFGYEALGPWGQEGLTESASTHWPRHLAQGFALLRELITGRRVHVLFHPIVRLDTRAPVGFEALGRGDQPGLDASPAALFRLAEEARLAPELSRLFLRRAVEEAVALPGLPLFCNVHPDEMLADSFVDSLRALPEGWRAGGRMVLEVHEDVVADTAGMRRLREQTRALGLGIAYDDFGAGQSRLVEVTEAPPDYVKLDRKVVQGIDEVSARQEIVQALARVSASLGFQLIAEGIETEAQAEVCRQLGCQLGQGFLFCRPQPAECFRPGDSPASGVTPPK